MNWVRYGSSATFETKSSYCRVARQSLHGSRKTWFQTSINLVRHGSSTTFETALNWWPPRLVFWSSRFLLLWSCLILIQGWLKTRASVGIRYNQERIKGAILSWYNSPFLFYNICRLFFLKIAQWNAKEKKKEKSYLIYSVVPSAHMAEILRNIVKSTMNICLRVYTYVKSHKQQNQHC